MATASSAPALEADTDYSDWKLEVEMWQGLTDLPESKQGLALTSAIAADHPLAIRKKVLKNLGPTKLKAEEGVESLIAYLDTILCVESEDERNESAERRQDSEKTATEEGRQKLDPPNTARIEEGNNISPREKLGGSCQEAEIQKQETNYDPCKKKGLTNVQKEAIEVTAKLVPSIVTGDFGPDILLHVLTEKLADSFGHKGPIQLAGVVLSTLAMSEIGMLLGVLSNPLTIDPYKLAQIKQMEMLKSIDKKLDKIMVEPLTTAIEKLSDVFDLLKEGERAEARVLLEKVSEKAQKAKNLDLPFPLHAQAVKIFIFAEIMKLQYDPGEENRDETGKPTPCFMPTFKLKKLKKEMIQKKLQAAKVELESVGQKKRNILGQSTQIMKEEYQQVIDEFLQAQYNVLSICKDFTNPTNMVDKKIKFKLAADFLPFEEEDSTPLPLGVLEKEQETLVSWVWRDAKNAFLRIRMQKFTIKLKHAENMVIQVQLTNSPDGMYFKCDYGEDLRAVAQGENGKLPLKMKKIQDLIAEAENAKSVSDLSLDAYQAAAAISPDYLKSLKIDFTEVQQDKNTLLHFIAQTPCSSKVQKERAKTIIDIIVSSGGKGVLTQQNAEGMSPLMLGLKKKQKCLPLLQIILELIETDSSKDYQDNTLVHHAARTLDDKDVGFLTLILDKLGRNFLEVRNKDGLTPYDVAISNKIREALSVA